MKRALTFGDYNPVHEGHVLGFKACLTVTDGLDIYVGRKPIPDQLPREIRMKSVDVALAAAGIQETTRQVNPDRLLDIDPKNYDALMMGSDVANALVQPSRLREFEREYFGSFGRIIVVQREVSPVDQIGLTALRQLGEIDVLDSVSASNASTIRDLWKNGENVKRLLTSEVWEVIEPHVGVWSLA